MSNNVEIDATRFEVVVASNGSDPKREIDDFDGIYQQMLLLFVLTDPNLDTRHLFFDQEGKFLDRNASKKLINDHLLNKLKFTPRFCKRVIDDPNALLFQEDDDHAWKLIAQLALLLAESAPDLKLVPFGYGSTGCFSFVQKGRAVLTAMETIDAVNQLQENYSAVLRQGIQLPGTF